MRLLQPTGFQLLAQGLVQQHAIQGAHDVEDIFGIDHDCSVADHLRDRRGIAGHNRRGVGHGLQRWQAEAFVERGEDEDLCLVVEDAQDIDGHKSEKAHIVLHPAFTQARRRSG